MNQVNESQLTCTCDEFQEIRRDTWQNSVRSCINCGKEYAYCFCNKICHKVTPGTIIKFNYEYLTCDGEECDYLGVRCTTCQKLCDILISKDENKMFWCCKTQDCQFFKQHVINSLKNHVECYKNTLTINVDILVKHIFRYVNTLKFIDILKKLFNAGNLNDTEF